MQIRVLRGWFCGLGLRIEPVGWLVVLQNTKSCPEKLEEN
jgi:hypothetical protein